MKITEGKKACDRGKLKPVSRNLRAVYKCSYLLGRGHRSLLRVARGRLGLHPAAAPGVPASERNRIPAAGAGVEGPAALEMRWTEQSHLPEARSETRTLTTLPGRTLNLLVLAHESQTIPMTLARPWATRLSETAWRGRGRWLQMLGGDWELGLPPSAGRPAARCA